jgi:hypothetical protein
VKRAHPSVHQKQPTKYHRKGDDDGNNEEHDPVATRVHAERTYINDIEGLVKFYRCRFDELTMKPLRKVITQWITKIEPQRSTTYGSYDARLPPDRPKGTTPPWWPDHCPYLEPSHLRRERTDFGVLLAFPPLTFSQTLSLSPVT